MSLVRGLALAALPFCVLQPFPDRGLFLRCGPARLILGFLQFLPTAAVVDDPVNHRLTVHLWQSDNQQREGADIQRDTAHQKVAVSCCSTHSGNEDYRMSS